MRTYRCLITSWIWIAQSGTCTDEKNHKMISLNKVYRGNWFWFPVSKHQSIKQRLRGQDGGWKVNNRAQLLLFTHTLCINYVIAMFLLVSCMTTQNHLLYFARFCAQSTPKIPKKVEGDRGRELGKTGGRRGTRGGRRRGKKRDSQSGGNWEKRRKNSQYCVAFHNSNRTKRREPLWKGAGSGSKRYGRREFQTPRSSSTTNSYNKEHFRVHNH